MRYAIQDNKKIHITDYKPDGGPLTCADGCCSARLKYIPKSRKNGTTNQIAHFASINRSEHRQNCTQLSLENDLYEESLSLKQAVQKGIHIILSLNDLYGLPPQLWQEFSATAQGGKPNTLLQTFKDNLRHPHTGEKGHSSHSIKSIKALISCINRIYEFGDDSALSKTWITWQDKTIRFSEFYLDTEESQKSFFRDLYKKSKCGNDFKCSVHNNEQSAWDVPRLFRFKPSMRTHENPLIGQLNGVAIKLKEKHEITKVPLILQHHVSMAFSKTPLPRQIFTNDVYVLATPQVNYTRTSEQICAYNAGSNRPKFVYLQWSVEGEHQFIPAKDIKLPKPYRGNEPKLI